MGLGQASQSVDDQCRMNVLVRFMQNPEKNSREILAQNDDFFKSSDSLFGEPLYVALHRKAKGQGPQEAA